MICESCENSEATVHLTQVVDGNIKKLHLCESCAKKSGFDIKGPMSITDVLLGLGSQKGPDDTAAEDSDAKVCAVCEVDLSEFRQKGRLGCPHCYETFEAEIMPLLDSMHHSTRHQGKMIAGATGCSSAGDELKALDQMLKDAVAGENYEEAAVLRDRISALRSDQAVSE